MVKHSLHRTWKNALRHDWIPEEVAESLPLLEIYPSLRWTKVVKDLVNFKEEKTNIFDIFKVIDRDKEPESKSILMIGM